MNRVDAHQHFWRKDRGDYGWLTKELGPIYRDFGPEDLRPHLERSRIHRTVVVQAAASLAETRFLLELAGRFDFIAGVVGWIPLGESNAVSELTALSAHPKFLGIRPMVQDLADDAWLLREELRPGLECLASLGLTFDALVKPRHLSVLMEFVDRYPDLRVVIDHGAKPKITSSGMAHPGMESWALLIAEIAKRPWVHCKLSGLLTEADRPFGLESLRPFADHLVESFGSDRILFGSDWPVLNLASDFETWHDMAGTLLAGLREDERDSVFGGNASRFYRLGEAP